MSLESVRAFFAEHAPDIAVIETPESSATVALAAAAHGVEPARIAKTLSLRIGERVVLVVARGDARLDNRKVKAALGGKPRMLDADEVVAITGHPVGGVCPFGLATPLPIYLRHLAEGLRRGRSGRGFDPKRRTHPPGTDGGTDQGRMGRCLPGSSLSHHAEAGLRQPFAESRSINAIAAAGLRILSPLMT